MALETRPYGKIGEKVTVIGLGGTRLYRSRSQMAWPLFAAPWSLV